MATSSSDARKKSPRAPSIAIDEALERVLKIYDQERLHAVPSDIAAHHMGHKDANNGRVLGILASLRYYGLIDRTGDGLVAVSKAVEAYKFAPSDSLKHSFLVKFLTTPPLFAELVDRYSDALPSDGALKYELIQRGFLPASAQLLVGIFKRSVNFVGPTDGNGTEAELEDMSEEEILPATRTVTAPVPSTRPPTPIAEALGAKPIAEESDHDRIPVRLPGNRRAWLVIPSVFFEADKARLKAQIDLLLTADEDDL